MMAGPSNDKCSRSVVCNDDPPPLSITLKELGDLPKKVKRWDTDDSAGDILLLTVEDCEFLACYHYLRDSFKSYEKSIGYFYFGKMGDNEEESLKVALVKCPKESLDPGGSQTAAKNAITLLRPKATFLVGFCYSLNPDKAQLGDVVISSQLTIDHHKNPVRRDAANLVRSAADGWKAPLQNPEAQKVKVHWDGEILSCSDLIGAEQQCQLHPGAIAVEMEGKGLFAAAHDMKMEWLVVKGVCGFVPGGATKKNSWKTFACVMAASVVSNMLSNSFVFGDWPHYGDTTPHTVVPTTGHGRELEESRGGTDTVPLLVSPTSDPEEELEPGELRMELPRMKDISAEEESCKSDDRSENKRTRLAGGATKHFRRPKVKRRDEESSPSDALTPKKRKARLAVKQGVPNDEDLEWLSQKLENWKTVGRRLEIDEARLTAFDDENRGCSEKIYKMLLHWKEGNGSTATYTILHDALCHPLVNRTDLAEQLITDNSTEEESCRRDDPSENKRRRLAEPLNVEKCQEQLKSHYETFRKVKIVPWDESSSIQIEKIYTPLSWVKDDRKPSGMTQDKLEDYTDMFKEDEYDRKPTRMLVYGRPGIGKSTFCKKAAYDWSKALNEILMNFCILLLIKLRDVCDVGNIRDVLRASKLLASDGPISVDSLYDYITNNQDKVLLILDGYDEYSFAEEHSPILEIWKGEQLRDCHVIVTTRQLKCDELRGPSHVQLEIQGFKSWERKETFARKFMAGEEDLNEFRLYLEEKDLDDMAEIPLLLLMLCSLWKEKRHEGLPKSRADIFTQFIQTMLDHKGGSHQPMPFQKVTSTEAKEDFRNLGKAAFEALLQGRLYVRCSELPGNISRSFQKLSEVGLFQIVNLTSLNPEKGAYFIHKSVQEFLAAWHIKEEVLSNKGESTPSLSKVESFEKIDNMREVLKFACELSTEAACAVFHHVGSVGRKESLSEFDFVEGFLEHGISRNETSYLELISHSYVYCSAEKRLDLCSVFPSCTGGVLDLDSNRVNITANKHLLKSGMIPDFIFFTGYKDPREKSYRDLITIAEDTNAVFLSCSGEKKAADLLKKFPPLPLDDFFLKRERKIVVYVKHIWRELGDFFPIEMLRELISPTAESTQVTRLVDPLNEHGSKTASSLTQNTDSITGPTPQSLSCVKNICIFGTERQEMKVVADCLPLFTALEMMVIYGKPFEIIDAQLTETLVSRIIFTDRLHELTLVYINLTAKPAAVVARSLHQSPSLEHLDLSKNPLGKGVSVLTQHLSRVPHLKRLLLYEVKMTKQQVNELSAAVRQSKISWLNTQYHDDEGNVKPEEPWPTDEYWGDHWSESEEESDPGSVINSGDEEEPGSFTASGDEEDLGSGTDSSDEEDPELVTDSGDEEDPGSVTDSGDEEETRS